MKTKYQIGQKFDILVLIGDGNGDVKNDWVEGEIVNFWENRIGHEAGVIMRTDVTRDQWIPFSLLHEDGSGM